MCIHLTYIEKKLMTKGEYEMKLVSAMNNNNNMAICICVTGVLREFNG